MQTAVDRPLDAPPDFVLLSRAATGDAESFRAVYERHSGAIRGYLTGRVGPDAADDLVSETFAEAWAARAKFDERMTSARPWLYGIATNVMARHREREERAVGEAEAPGGVDVAVKILHRTRKPEEAQRELEAQGGGE